MPCDPLPAAAKTLARSPAPAPPPLPPISFQDFLQLVDMQFLDHVRRGTSINMADLAADPPPRSLAECLTLVALVAPEVAGLESAIGRLQRDITAKRTGLVEAENALAEVNPPIFRTVQVRHELVLMVWKISMACCTLIVLQVIARGTSWPQCFASSSSACCLRLQAQRRSRSISKASRWQ